MRPRAVAIVLGSFGMGGVVAVLSAAQAAGEPSAPVPSTPSSAVVLEAPASVLEAVNAKVVVPGATVVVGHRHSCALRLDGTVLCWGDNSTGQLGDGTKESRATPALVLKLRDVAQIALGDWHTCALKNDGTVECWGANGYGQLGDGTDVEHILPLPVPKLADVVQIASGRTHLCARTKDLRLRCWGSNIAGEVGVITQTEKVGAPRLVPSLPGVEDVGLGWAHTCARLVDHTVKCFGGNQSGEIGDGTTSIVSAPSKVKGLEDVVQLAVGAHHACARFSPESGGKLACWGRNGHGELGDGTTLDRPSPIVLKGLAGVVDLSLGVARSCARTGDGIVRCWGLDGFRHAPAEVEVVTSPKERADLFGAVELSLREHACFRRVEGGVFCVGSNDFGELGDGTWLHRDVPVPVVGL